MEPVEPQATPPQVVEAPAALSGCEQYRSLVAQYAWDVDIALAVMRAESGCDPSAVGDLRLTYQGSGRREGMSCGLIRVRVLAGRPDCDGSLTWSDVQIVNNSLATETSTPSVYLNNGAALSSTVDVRDNTSFTHLATDPKSVPQLDVETLEPGHFGVELNTTATQTLPALATSQGRIYEFVIINAAAATIKGSGTELLGNVTTANTYMLASGAAVTLKAFPSVWRVI